MKSLRKTITVKEGVGVNLLFTPHLFSFKGKSGVTFEYDPKSEREVLEAYADIIYCAGLNAWVLDGKGSEDEAPFTRGDIHEWVAMCPKDFAKIIPFAVEAITGKPMAAAKAEVAPDDGKKKVSGLIGWVLRRFSSGVAE